MNSFSPSCKPVSNSISLKGSSATSICVGNFFPILISNRFPTLRRSWLIVYFQDGFPIVFRFHLQWLRRRCDQFGPSFFFLLGMFCKMSRMFWTYILCLNVVSSGLGVYLPFVGLLSVALLSCYFSLL